MGDDLWTQSATGMQLPRGTVVSYQATESELLNIEAKSLRRGVRDAQNTARGVRRSESDAAAFDSLCRWLHFDTAGGFDVLGTVTFTDEYAARYGIYSIRRALQDVRLGLSRVPMRRDSRRVGFYGAYVLCGEWHPSGRCVPHVHLVAHACGEPVERVCSELYSYFFATRGRSRFEPMRDQTAATLYGLKDTIKASIHEPDSLVLRLKPSRARRGRRR